MVALIIIAVGMLGIAKMQALALSTTETSGVRSLVAIEAASLAASMHTNRDYWVAGPPPAVTNVTVTTRFGPSTTWSPSLIATNVLSTAPTLAAARRPQPLMLYGNTQVAAYDVQQWGAALGQVVPAALATISCNTTTVPLSCTIQITWQENVTSTNNATAAVSSAANVLNSPQYTLYVEP